MIAVELSGVNFGIAKNDGGATLLAFEDEKSGWRFVVPFTPDGWASFKRHVESDGAAPAIQIVPNLSVVEPKL